MRLRERRGFRALGDSAHSKRFLFTVSRGLLLIAVFWGEFGIFKWTLWSCDWPQLDVNVRSINRILLLSDPQVRYHPSWHETLSIGRVLYNLNLQKSWRAAQRLNPDVVIMLGDMLAQGKLIKDEARYERYVQDFHQLFPPLASTKVYYLPGNNDVGMGTFSTRSKLLGQYFRQYFGPLNRVLDIRGHTLVLLDSPGLVEEDYQRSASGSSYDYWTPLPGGSVEFAKNITTESPLILLTHIPLYRPATASCGPLRERGTIRKGVGHGYQSTLGKQTTDFLFNTLHPMVVFTGDDRDYCEYIHHGNSGDGRNKWPIREVTVKSFSMSRHIKRPGFQLLSLAEPSNEGLARSYADTLCLLPNQQAVYWWLYTPLSFVVLFVILLFHVRQRRSFRSLSIDPISPNINPYSARRPTSPQPDSAIWSPYTPRNPVSPRNTLPRSLRTPQSAAGPTLRADTPQGSPLLAPIHYPPDDEESIDSVDHFRFDSHRGSYQHDGWTPEHEPNLDEDSYFSSPGYTRSLKTEAALWSKTFVFRGRRRRVTVSIPRILLGLKRIMAGADHRTRTRRWSLQDMLTILILDACSVFGPAFLLWAFMSWYIL